MTRLEIKGFIETSFLDWDGKVVSTIFLPACNFCCPFCQNRQLVENPQSLETISLERIEKFLLEHKEFIDGVCITGGEPCLHKDRGLFEFMRRIKELGFLVKLDTNGEDPEVIEKGINEGLIDYVAMDVKAPLDERYDKLSGVKTDLTKIKQSISLLMQGKIDYEFRTTVVPTLLDAKNIKDIARGIAGAKKFVLQQFVPENSWKEEIRAIKPYAREKLQEMAEACRPFVANTLIRGA